MLKLANIREFRLFHLFHVLSQSLSLVEMRDNVSRVHFSYEIKPAVKRNVVRSKATSLHVFIASDMKNDRYFPCQHLIFSSFS